MALALKQRLTRWTNGDMRYYFGRNVVLTNNGLAAL